MVPGLVAQPPFCKKTATLAARAAETSVHLRSIDSVRNGLPLSVYMGAKYWGTMRDREIRRRYIKSANVNVNAMTTVNMGSV